VLMPPRPPREQDAMNEHIAFDTRRTSEPNTDTWNGYASDRDRLLGRIEDDRVADTVFLTGDVHSAWATEVPSPATGAPVAVELVCSSLTSNNVDDFMGTRARTTSLAMEAAIQQENPHVKWVNLDDHGYAVLHVTDERLQMDWHAISDRRDPHGTSRVLASWAVEAGSSRVRPVRDPVPA
jgi:alkaline phosphatase D